MGRMRVLAHHTHTHGTQFTHYTKHTQTHTHTHTHHTHTHTHTTHTTHTCTCACVYCAHNPPMGVQSDSCAPESAKKVTVSEMKHQKILNCKSTFFISDWLSDLPIIMEDRQALEANMAEILEGRHIIPCKRHRVPVNGRKYCSVCICVCLYH